MAAFTRRVLLALSVLVLLAVPALAAVQRHVYTLAGDEDMPRIVVKCDGFAEDSMAHLKLKKYTDTRIVYRCMEGGY